MPKVAEKFANIEALDNAEAVAEANKPAAAAPKVEGDSVEITITKFGDGKVSTGVHVAGEGDIYASRGDKLTVSREVAARLEELGVAEAD